MRLQSEDFVNIAKDGISKTIDVPVSEIHVVWQCKTLQHHKGLFMTPQSKSYWEVTYNGDAGEMYIDAYTKQNQSIIILKGEQ